MSVRLIRGRRACRGRSSAHCACSGVCYFYPIDSSCFLLSLLWLVFFDLFGSFLCVFLAFLNLWAVSYYASLCFRSSLIVPFWLCALCFVLCVLFLFRLRLACLCLVFSCAGRFFPCIVAIGLLLLLLFFFLFLFCCCLSAFVPCLLVWLYVSFFLSTESSDFEFFPLSDCVGFGALCSSLCVFLCPVCRFSVWGVVLFWPLFRGVFLFVWFLGVFSLLEF